MDEIAAQQKLELEEKVRLELVAAQKAAKEKKDAEAQRQIELELFQKELEIKEQNAKIEDLKRQDKLR